MFVGQWRGVLLMQNVLARTETLNMSRSKLSKRQNTHAGAPAVASRQGRGVSVSRAVWHVGCAILVFGAPMRRVLSSGLSSGHLRLNVMQNMVRMYKNQLSFFIMERCCEMEAVAMFCPYDVRVAGRAKKILEEREFRV